MSNQFDDIYYVDEPTVYLGTLKAGDRFWFRGDWRSEPGIYTLDGFDDLKDPVVREFKDAWDTGAWFANVSVVPIDEKKTSQKSTNQKEDMNVTT